ncbi:MAG: response regulator transcription factor [Thermomicrobiales bacterium]
MKVLVVEDELRLAALLRRALAEDGHAVECVGTGEEALQWLGAAPFDLVILDVMLPGMSGIEVCRTARERKLTVPILLLTARAEVEDRVAGLDAGADDYLTKPFALSELMARLRALTRRPRSPVETVLEAGGIRLDPAGMYAWRDDQPVTLARKEFRILEYLVRNAGRVVTRDMIANHVWDYEFPNATNVIDVHIRTLRKKLGDPYPGTLIETVRGVGYRVPSDRP